MRRRRKKQVKIVIVLSICLLFIMSAGYAAFSTNLTLAAKGTVIGTFTFKDLINRKVSSGDGLYSDPVDSDRYVYRGVTPENYIEFNGETWRILAIEADGTAKVMKQETIGGANFDVPYSRSDSTYCSISSNGNYGQNIDSRYGCNAWVSENGNFTNGNITGTVTKDATLNTYLNGDYYNSLDVKSQRQIQKHNFYYGGINSYDMKVLNEQEKAKIWNGNIALINLSDYQKASLIESCSLTTNCLDQNYIYDDIIGEGLYCWTLDILLNDSLIIRDLYRGKTNTSFAFNGGYLVYPVLFLRADLLVYGKGTKEEPFKIKLRS